MGAGQATGGMQLSVLYWIPETTRVHPASPALSLPHKGTPSQDWKSSWSLFGQRKGDWSFTCRHKHTQIHTFLSNVAPEVDSLRGVPRFQSQVWLSGASGSPGYVGEAVMGRGLGAPSLPTRPWLSFPLSLPEHQNPTSTPVYLPPSPPSSDGSSQLT